MTVNRASQWPSRVLMVEDSVVIAMEAESCLLELGVDDVMLATSANDALRLLDRSEGFGLAILDYNLTNETSEPVARRLAEQGTPFAVTSGYTDLHDHFTQLGAQWVLTKPYSKADLRGVLEAASELSRV